MSPSAHSVECALEVTSCVCQLVLDPEWRPRQDAPDHEPLGFQLAKAVGAETFRHPWYCGDELVEPQRSIQQHPHDGARPSLADQLDSPVVQGADHASLMDHCMGSGRADWPSCSHPCHHSLRLTFDMHLILDNVPMKSHHLTQRRVAGA